MYNTLACVLPAVMICLFTGDNILTAVSVARQCGLVPAEDRLVYVNAYSPDADGSPARIDWVCHEDSVQCSDPDTTPREVMDCHSKPFW